jgi:Xaa-Pro aminopeptidase
MKNITVIFTKSPNSFNLGYGVGETGEFDEKQAKELFRAGVAEPVEAEDALPEDLPGRKQILNAGLSLEELKEVKDFTEIKGITKAIAEKLTEYFA